MQATGAAQGMGANEAQAMRPFAVRAGDGEALWWFGSLTVVKASAADTAGQMSILELTEPPDMEGPLHVHHHEDEGFWILEGGATFEVGGETIEARAGDFVFGPRGIPHRYSTGPDGCRLLFIFTPGGFENMVREMGRPAERRALPPPSDEPPDMERVAAIAAKYGNELLG
jgi:mannose-6-phosphate isomerase-like protein (cupin superfamily)